MYSKITPGKLFKVNNKTGVITLTGKLDYETQRQYALVIKAEDLQDKNKVDYTTVIIHVTDVNDNAPVFVDYPKKTIRVDVVMYTVFNRHGNVPYFIFLRYVYTLRFVGYDSHSGVCNRVSTRE